MQAFKAVMFQVEVLWAVLPYCVMVGYQRFGGPCCLHLQGEDSIRSLWVVVPRRIVGAA